MQAFWRLAGRYVVVSKVLVLAKAAALGTAYTAFDTRKRDTAELITLASDLDDKKFNNWFWQNNVSYLEIAAMWQTESAGCPRATNLTGGDGAQGGSWGIGQVTALTATDYGILMPLAPLMLYPRIGGRVSMSHIQAVVKGLRASGRAGNSIEWVQAYNVGLTGFIDGRTNSAHYQRFISHLA